MMDKDCVPPSLKSQLRWPNAGVRLPLSKDKPLAEALKAPPVRIMPQLANQMEGACYDADSRTIWFTSERLPAPLFRVTR